jgi:putative nucleotidyltransferase with HDIG domain
MLDLKALVEKAQDLEPLPATTVRLSALVADPDGRIEDIVALIQIDAVLAAKVLRLANSAASGSSRTIGTVREAVVRVGGGTALSLAVAGKARTTLRRDLPQFGIDGATQWKHSVAAALAADVLRGVSRLRVPPEAFTAALLHDIGKLVMASFLEADAIDWLERARQSGLSALKAEAEVLGVNHAELGGLVAQHWGLPESIVRGVTFHHSPDDGNDPICDVVCVANQLARESGVAPMPPDLHPDDTAGAWSRMGMTKEKFAQLGEKVAARFGEVETLFS